MAATSYTVIISVRYGSDLDSSDPTDAAGQVLSGVHRLREISTDSAGLRPARAAVRVWAVSPPEAAGLRRSGGSDFGRRGRHRAQRRILSDGRQGYRDRRQSGNVGASRAQTETVFRLRRRAEGDG